MRVPCRLAACLLLSLPCAAALAQATTAVAPPASAALPASAPQRVSTTRVQVIEDRNVRIEETRVRGQLQRVVVQSKLPGARPYDIEVGAGGRDPSQDRGVAGRSSWSLFGF